ncbi:hypothetical protein CLOM_g13183 [Closterium sp. NIES-68]|nr:hypothetical protein CLOM_g13183 [Closterium sp. NIES-68]
MTMAALVLHPNTVSGASQPFPHHSFSTEPSQPGNPAACAGQAIVEPSRTRLRAILPRPGAACHGEKRAAPDDAPAGLEPPRKYLATSPPQTPPPSVATGSALTPGAPCVGSTAPIPVQPAVSATRAIGPNQRSVMAKPSVLGSLFAAPSVPRPLHSPPPAPGATPSSFSATPPPPLLAPRASYDPLAFARGMQALHGTALGRLMHTAPDIVVDGIPRRLLVPTPGSTAAKLGLLAPSVAPVLLPPAAPAPSLAAAAGHALPCAPTSSSGSHSWRYQLSTEATAQARIMRAGHPLAPALRRSSPRQGRPLPQPYRPPRAAAPLLGRHPRRGWSQRRRLPRAIPAARQPSHTLPPPSITRLRSKQCLQLRCSRKRTALPSGPEACQRRASPRCACRLARAATTPRRLATRVAQPSSASPVIHRRQFTDRQGAVAA